MPKGRDTRNDPNRRASRNWFQEGKTSAVERQLPLVPGGLTESERNAWEEGYDYGETVVNIPFDERNVHPRGQ